MNALPSSETQSGRRTVTVDRLRRFCAQALRSAGMGERDAHTGADVLVTTDAWGVFTHGTKSLHGYLRRLHEGGLNPVARPQAVAEGPAWALVDGHSALGLLTSAMAMELAVARARTQGIAYVGVRNSCHFGAAGYYAWLAAREGQIGIAMANDTPSVTAPGARGAVIGSNPLAFAVPAGRHKPIMLDIATSTVAGGKVYAARALGKPIPGDWIVGADGRPTTDPSGFPAVGALLPMAGHKGYGLALLIETLSGILSGAAVTRAIGSWIQSDPSLPTGHGAAFLAIDVSALAPLGDFKQRVDALIDEIHSAPKADDADRIYVPGEREWERHDRALAKGIELPQDVLESLGRAAELSGQNVESLFG